MSILLAPRPRVKPARVFGQGILRSLPTHRADHTAGEAAWFAADNARREAEDRYFERLADESAFMDRYEKGLC